MRAVVQRVSQARVDVDGVWVGAVDRGLLVYLGVETGDGETDLDLIADKIAHLRIFEDDAGKMNLSVGQITGQILVIPAFSLAADARKGRRPSFTNAAEPEQAQRFYNALVDRLRREGLHVETGRFQQHMQVTATNDGPICILLDSRKTF